MAIVPNDNEAFFREVDEELRRDRFERLAARYWRLGAVALVLLLVLLAGVLAWRAHRQAQIGGDAEQLSAALASLGGGDAASAGKPLDQVAASPRVTYRALAGLTNADMAAEKGDLLHAIARFRLVADDPDVAQPLRDVALVRQTVLEYDVLKPAEVIARMKPLAVPGGPWFGSAGEMVAMAYQKSGKPAEAGLLFAQIARDAQVPDTIRSRAAQMASGLGVDTGLTIDPAGAGGQ